MKSLYRFGFLSFFATFLLAMTQHVSAAEQQYAALQGVDKVKAVFDVSMGSARLAPAVFWAVRNTYRDESVLALPEEAEVAVVFHGPAVKLISTSREGYDDEEKKALDEFAEIVRQMKADGVRMEVCMYAVKVLGVDPATILPEIDKVGNGFISVVGYQARGYSLVALP